MEEELCKAAKIGDVDRIGVIRNLDELILNKIMSGIFKMNPLHVAITENQVGFVRALLDIKSELAEVLESGRSPLHMAVAKGNVEIVRALVKASKKMCFARDQHGMNPLHVAAMEGKEEVLKELVEVCPQAALEKLDRDGTILHLCIKHGQLGTLDLLLECRFHRLLVNAQDSCGNTILHLAVCCQNSQIVYRLLHWTSIDRDAVNAGGHTALDMTVILYATDYKKVLLEAGCKRKVETEKFDWLSGKRETLMVVASLIATMAFQAVMTPPAGVWQEDSYGHRAGEAVMAYKYPHLFPYFLNVNTVTFVVSLNSILLLIKGMPTKKTFYWWVLVLTTWLTITSTTITYVFYIKVVTPKKDRRCLRDVLIAVIILWVNVAALPLAGFSYKLIKQWLKAILDICLPINIHTILAICHILIRLLKKLFNKVVWCH